MEPARPKSFVDEYWEKQPTIMAQLPPERRRLPQLRHMVIPAFAVALMLVVGYLFVTWLAL
ncbi:MAG: hypothetical protein KGL35_11880 [Bradyrhizobium sp.]|nr:hypothetical protein [Bradyrhizobium sp.]